MKWLVRLVAVLVLVSGAGVLAHAAAGDAGGGSGCTNATVAGSWGYQFLGGIFEPSGAGTDFGGVGVITFDGTGRVTGGDTLSIGGMIVPRTYTGLYAIDSECRGRIDVTDNTGQAGSAIFILSDGRTVSHFMFNDPGSVVSGTAVPIRAGCTNATTTGQYVSVASGAIFVNASGAPTLGGARLAVTGVGLNDVDGAGRFSGSETFSIGGQVASRTFSGTYTTRADCTGTFSVTDDLGQSSTGFFVVVEGGQGFYFISTDPASVVVVTGRRQ